MKKINVTFYMIIFMFMLEIIFNYLCFGNVELSNCLYIILFSIPFATIISVICNLSKKTLINKIIFIVFTLLVTFTFEAQLVYFEIYEAFFSIDSLAIAGQAVEARSRVISAISTNINSLVILILPFAISIVLVRFINFEKNTKLYSCSLVAVAILLQLSVVEMIKTTNKENLFSTFNLYYNSSLSTITTKNFGLLTNIRLDVTGSNKNVSNGIGNFNVDVSDDNIDLNSRYEIEANEIDIDFNKLITNETDNDVKFLHQYFSSQSKTFKNLYTGMFEGKNVIYILAESFTTGAIDKELTPTLYKLANTGFVFNNYYVPLYPVSTGDGEYVAEWGLLPNMSVSRSMTASKDNYSPYLFLNVFDDYDINVYHNYIEDFYDRGIYFSSLGYDNVKFCKNGLDVHCFNLHSSDYDLVKETFPEYSNANNFFTYYITVGGHGGYGYKGNFIVQRNWDKVKDLQYSNQVKGYLAAAIELDKALEYLINELDKSGKLDDTVFVMTPDHYPYYLNDSDLSKLSGINKKDKFLKHKSSLIIWNSAMEESVVVDKVVSSVDVLPTLLNLVGYDYDSRLLIGVDALSTKEGIVMFSDGSFLTDYGRYDAITEKFIANEGVNVPSKYASSVKEIVNLKFKVSKLVQETNYYTKIK